MRRVLLTFAMLSAAAACAAPISLVHGGTSDFVIYRAADAPPSVLAAAQDLQDYLQRATGAKLSIVDEPATRMICLGDNPSARAAGLDVRALPLEGFRLLTTGGNIYIAGPDTAADQRTVQGGTSNGTANGVYTFLERFVGVRWLDPTEHGDYVPRSADLVIPDTDLTDAPFFLNRRVPYTQQNRPEVQRWWARQRLGWSLFLHHAHNWEQPTPPELFEQHPDWFAERGGRRVPPTGRYKLCVTNPGLISHFARQVIAHFDAHPESTCYSLSPSDSAGWCECPNCTALYERDPNGNLSVTPAILHFYNGVAKIVREKYPDKILAGYVYAAYVFPPRQPIPLEPNVFLVWAPSFDYGYTLFRPELRVQWEQLLAQWTQTTSNLAYYDLPANISTESGALNPPGLKILAFIYPRLKQANIKGVYVYGIEGWGRGGPLNYLLAKLAWDPGADVEALFAEYCQKAYGEGASAMEQLWRLLDAEFERHYQENPAASYVLTTDIMRDIYVRNWAEIERLYRAAEAQITDADARARLQMVGDNLTVLHWTLRQFKLLPAAETSSFYLADADFFNFLGERRNSLALEPRREQRAAGRVRGNWAVAPVSEVPNAEAVERHLLRGDQHLIIQPTGGGPARVRFSSITARGKLVTWTLLGARGEAIADGLMSAEVPVEMDQEGSAFYHLLISAGSASFRVDVERAAWAVNGTMSNQGLHFLGKLSPVYFEVPPGVASFHLGLGAEPPGETALATLYAPDGREVARFNCTEVPLDYQQIAAGPNDAGWWKLVVSEAPTGVIDDVYIKPGPELSGFFAIAPVQALSVRHTP